MLVGVAATLFAPEPPSDIAPHKPHAGFVETIWAPIRNLLKRLGPMRLQSCCWSQVFACRLYRQRDGGAGLQASRLHQHRRRNRHQAVRLLDRAWRDVFGWLADTPHWQMASLLMGTVAGSASHLAHAFLAAHGDDGGAAFWMFAPAVGIEGFAYAFASVVLITDMSTLASVEHAASQFGLLTSLCAFPGSILAGFSGFVIERTGFVWFFIWTSLIGIPVAMLAIFVWYRVGISDETLMQSESGH